MNRTARAIALILSIAIAIPYAWTQAKPDTHPITKDEKGKLLGDIAKTLDKDAFLPGVDFHKWDTFVAAEKPELDKASTQEDFTMAINEAFQKFGITHVGLFPPAFAELRSTQKKAGFGMRFERGSSFIVVYVFKGSPAETAGIVPGDKVVKCDGKDVKTIEDLYGDKGQASDLTVVRNGHSLPFHIIRDDFSTVIPETLTWDDDVAVIKIPTFDIGYDSDNVDHLMSQAASAKGIVVDLRDNGGGKVMNLLHLSSYFLDRETQPLGTFLGKSAVEQYEKDHSPTTDLKAIADATVLKVRAMKNKQGLFKGPVSVLINGNSGSASEMFAAAIREQKGGKLFGSRSAGAVLASIMKQLPEGFLIQYPLFDYVTIKGHRLEGSALVPDKAAATPEFGQPDLALSYAKQWIDSSGASRE